MKNYLDNAIKDFMEDHDLQPNEQFMLFENNTNDDTYYGTYEIQLTDPAKNYELVNISLPSLIDDENYNYRIILNEILSGEYEVRKLEPNNKYVYLCVKKQTICRGNETSMSERDKLDDIKVFSNEEAATRYLKLILEADLTSHYTKEERKGHREKIENDIAHGILSYELKSFDENNIHVTLNRSIYKSPVYKK